MFAHVFILVAAMMLVMSCVAFAQSTPHVATLTIRANQPGETIRPEIYGHFAEHLGRCIYEGIWVGEDSPIPNTRGIRNDVVEALKKLKVPVLRWPGGCFADEYHWRDGIGPRDQRPRRLNASWGGVETNAFGTHEFMDLCEMIGAEPYISGNVGSGTPQEMMAWIEYMTSDSDSTLAEERRANGRDKPWKVRYFAVGNENWGCGGNMTAEYYANEFRRYNTYIKNLSGNRVYRIACGSGWDDWHWTEVMMEQVGNRMNGLSLHHYTLPTASWRGSKGSATDFEEDQWHSTMVQTLRIVGLIEGHSAIMDKKDPEKRIGLIVDEWGTWYDTTPGQSALHQQNSIRDAVVAGVNLNIFHQHCDRVRMANIAQLVNVLQAVILTDKQKMILTPTYHVLEMYNVHQGATLLPVELETPQYEFDDKSVPALHASASRDESGKIHLSIVNLDPNRPATVTMNMTGAETGQITGRILTAPAMNSHNTFEDPNAVVPVGYDGVRKDGDNITLSLPAKSVVVVEIR